MGGGEWGAEGLEDRGGWRRKSGEVAVRERVGRAGGGEGRGG